MLLLWLRMIWLRVNLTTVIACLGVSQLLILVSCNVFKIVYLELLPIQISIHTSLLLGRLSIGYPLNTVPYLRLPYWCTISYRVVIQNILYPSLNLDIVSKTHAKAKQMMHSLRSHTFLLQYISPLSILASALLMMLQRSGKICLIMYSRPLLSTHSERSSKPISLHKHMNPNFSYSWFLSVAQTLAMSQVNDYSFLLFLFGVPRVCLSDGD